MLVSEKQPEKLLILGSDYGTIDIAQQAKKRGLYVIATDLMETSPTKAVADQAWTVSTADIDRLEQLCKKNGVTAIITGASDFNIEKSRELCKRLDLPLYCSNDRAWQISTNKRLFKDLCKQLGAPVAQDYHLSDELTEEELNAIAFPVVVKPVDLSGNRGMSYCSNCAELKTAFAKAKEASSNGTIIVERELHGPEFYVNYAIADGEAVLQFFTSEHNEPGLPDNLYSIIITTSYQLKKYLAEVNDKVIEVFKQAGCREGIAWVETILDEDGSFYLLEMGYRHGGDIITAGYKNICGFDTIDWMIDISCGIQHSPCDLPKPLTEPTDGVAASYYLFAREDGSIAEIIGLDEVEAHPYVSMDIPKREGGSVKALGAMGMARLHAKNIDELCATIDFINKTLFINDSNGDNMFVKYTDFSALHEEHYKGLCEYGLAAKGAPC